MTYFRNQAYDHAPFGNRSVSQNLLGKVLADLGNGTRATAQFTYTPYISQAASGAGINNTITSRGGGYAARLNLDRTGVVVGRWTQHGRATTPIVMRPKLITASGPARRPVLSAPTASAPGAGWAG